VPPTLAQAKSRSPEPAAFPQVVGSSGFFRECLRRRAGVRPRVPLRAARAVREGGPVASVDFVRLRLTKSTLATGGRRRAPRAALPRASRHESRVFRNTFAAAPRGWAALPALCARLDSPPPEPPPSACYRTRANRAERPRPRPASGRARRAAAPGGRPRPTSDRGRAPASSRARGRPRTHAAPPHCIPSLPWPRRAANARGVRRAPRSNGRGAANGGSPTPPAPPPAHHPRSRSQPEPSPDGERRATRPRRRRGPLARGPRTRSPC
jgi:hypothetical protein